MIFVTEMSLLRTAAAN